MKHADFWSGIFWLLIGIWVTVESFGFDLGRWDAPGPGFLPFCAGVLLAGLSLVLTVRAVPAGGDVGSFAWANGLRWGKWGLTLAALVAYALLLEWAGFILTTFLFLLFLLAVVERQRWMTIFLVAVLTAVASYLIFEVWLKSQLPAGFLGI